MVDEPSADGLDEATAGADPIVLVRRWHAEAGSDDSVVLATATADGVPSARVVLCKRIDAAGFEVHTNRNSRKAGEMDSNPRAALVFHWPPSRQVRVEGRVERIDDSGSDEYWATRPRASRLGAWASAQSEPIVDRAALEQHLAEVEARFEGVDDVPRPPHWGGYRVVPERIEVWCHRADRLHDRLRYRRDPQAPSGWVLERLAP